MWRIDVLGVRPDGIDVIEVKPRAGTSAVRQVRLYCDALQHERPELSPVRAVILTDTIVRGMVELCHDNNVMLVIV
jgi:RecB family endonuclease NucS